MPMNSTDASPTPEGWPPVKAGYTYDADDGVLRRHGQFITDIGQDDEQAARHAAHAHYRTTRECEKACEVERLKQQVAGLDEMLASSERDLKRSQDALRGAVRDAVVDLTRQLAEVTRERDELKSGGNIVTFEWACPCGETTTVTWDGRVFHDPPLPKGWVHGACATCVREAEETRPR